MAHGPRGAVVPERQEEGVIQGANGIRADVAHHGLSCPLVVRLLS